MKRKSASALPFFNPRLLTAHQKQSAMRHCRMPGVIPYHTARSAQGALIAAAALAFWCAFVPGTNTAQAQPPPYPKGIWAAAGVDDDLPPEVINNLGVVGVGVSEDWEVVNPAPGVYDWTQL